MVTTARGILVEQPKTSSGQRVVDLDSLTVEMLRDHRKRQEKDAQALRMPPPSIVFPRNGLEGWCHPNTLSNTLERLAKEAGCPEVTARSLRHFHATVSLQASQNVVVASKAFGPLQSQHHPGYLRPRLARLAERGSGGLRTGDGSGKLKMLDKCWTKFQQSTSTPRANAF